MFWQNLPFQRWLSRTSLAGVAFGFACGLGAVPLWEIVFPEPPVNEMIREMNRTSPHWVMDGVRLNWLTFKDDGLWAYETVEGPPGRIDDLGFELQRLSAPAFCTGKGLLPRLLRAAKKIIIDVKDEHGSLGKIGVMTYDGCDDWLHSPPTND